METSFPRLISLSGCVPVSAMCVNFLENYFSTFSAHTKTSSSSFMRATIQSWRGVACACLMMMAMGSPASSFLQFWCQTSFCSLSIFACRQPAASCEEMEKKVNFSSKNLSSIHIFQDFRVRDLTLYNFRGPSLFFAAKFRGKKWTKRGTKHCL